MTRALPILFLLGIAAAACSDEIDSGGGDVSNGAEAPAGSGVGGGSTSGGSTSGGGAGGGAGGAAGGGDADGNGGGSDGGLSLDGAAPPPPKFTGTATPEGCIQNVAPGARGYTCEGLAVEATIPVMTNVCPAAGCGLIVELHGDTGTGALIDAHLNLRARASAKGYIVIAPTGPAINVPGYPGSSWDPNQDAKVVAITKLFAKVFKVDTKRIHATGFSRGGMMTWRLGCDQSELFASIAPAAAGNASTWLRVNQIEPTCFTAGRAPSRKLPILFLLGRTDVPIPYNTMTSIRAAAMANYGISAAQVTTVTNTAQVLHQRTNNPGAPVIEWFDHAYETAPNGTAAAAKGHCVPGSTYSPTAAQYAYACAPPTAFDWGAQVLAFFDRTPKP